MATWSSLPVELKIHIGEMLFEYEGTWECALMANPVNLTSTRRPAELTQLALLCRLDRAMNMYFTPILWRYLSYTREEDLHNKPNLQHVKRLHLGFDVTMRDAAALIQQILSFVKLLPTLEYGHVSLNLTAAPGHCRIDYSRRRHIDAEDQKMIQSLLPQLDTAFTDNGAPANWDASCVAWMAIISGSSSIAMPALSRRHRPTLTINAPNVTGHWVDHGLVLLGNDSIAALTEASELDMEDDVAKDPIEWLKIDTAMQGFSQTTFEYLESVSKRISHLRIGGSGGMWSKSGRIYYETDPWPINVRGSPHNFDNFNLHTLSLHVTTSSELNDVRKMILFSHNTLQYLDILLNTHFLESLLRLVDYVKSFHDDNLSHSSLKEVHVHWAGPNWAQDNLAEEESVFAHAETNWNVYGVREGNRHTLARWSKILQLGKDGEALRPLKEDLWAVLAGYWKQKDVIFKMTGIGRELDFVYEWPVYGEHTFFHEALPDSDEGGEEIVQEEEQNSGAGSSDNWDGDELSSDEYSD